jgi:predicted nuclease of restriction endonuclease-like RecB superfamily
MGEREDKIWATRRARGKSTFTPEQRERIRQGMKMAWAEGRARGTTGIPVPQERRNRIAATVHDQWEAGVYDNWDTSYRTPEHFSRHSALMKQKYSNGEIKPSTIKSARHPYKDLSMRSQAEVRFAGYLDEMSLVWQYEPEKIDLGWATYIPDFYLPDHDHWIEVKGVWTPDSKKKYEEFSETYKVSLFRANKLRSKVGRPRTLDDILAGNSQVHEIPVVERKRNPKTYFRD